jgi:hypothetical protein
VCSPWLAEGWHSKVPTEFEIELANEALTTGNDQPLELGGAWPIFDGFWRRVVVVISVDE